MCEPKITVLTISYNAVKTIEETMLSVIGQTYPNIEYLIVDGGSNDGTVDIIKQYGNAVAKWVSEKDNGLYYAMNKGIEMATGDWICYMNCGDKFVENDTISKLFKVPVEESVKVVYGDTMVAPVGKPLVFSKGNPISVISKFQPFYHQSAFFSLRNKNDLRFDGKRYKYCADYDVTCRIYKKYGKASFEYRPVPVAQYELGPGLSYTHAEACRREYIRIKIRNRMNPIEILRDITKMILRMS